MISNHVLITFNGIKNCINALQELQQNDQHEHPL